MYRIAICDDDAAFLKDMEELIRKSGEFTGEMEVECFENGEALLSADVRNFTLVIIDMCIHAEDGFSVARRIREVNEDAVIIFCSGVVEPKTEHFEVQPFRYIAKQTDMGKVEKTISESLKYMKQKYYKAYVIVTSDGKAKKIDIDDVVYIYPTKRGTYLKVQSEEKGEKEYHEYFSNQMIKEWYTELLQNGFEFPSLSFLVNMKHVNSIEKNVITVDDGTQILLTRKYRKNFIERFALFFDKKYRRNAGK